MVKQALSLVTVIVCACDLNSNPRRCHPDAGPDAGDTPDGGGAAVDAGRTPDGGGMAVDAAGVDAGNPDATPVAFDTWEATMPLPVARYDPGASVYAGRIYVLGGDQGGNVQRNDVIFAEINPDGTLGSWTETTPFPTVRFGLTSVAVNGYLYVIGGGNAADQQIADVSYAPINPDGTVGAWVSTTPLPAPRQDHGTVVHDGRIYVLAGNQGEAGINHEDVQVATINIDGSLGAWSALTDLPSPRSDHTSVEFGDFLYAIGGGVTGTGNTDEVLAAPINADGTIGVWTASTPLLSPRAAGATVVVGGTLFHLGGFGATYLADVDRAPFIGGGVGAWSSTTPLPSARGNFAAVTANGRIYTIGGFRSGPVVLDEVLVMTPSAP